MESEYNIKNRQRMVSMEDRQHWDDVFGTGKLYALSSLRVCGMFLVLIAPIFTASCKQ